MDDSIVDQLLEIEGLLYKEASSSRPSSTQLSLINSLLKKVANDGPWGTDERFTSGGLDCIQDTIECIETATSIFDGKLFLEKMDHSKAEGEGKLDTFNASRKEAIERTIVTDRSDMPDLEEIVGLCEAKGALREALIDPILYPEWFSSSGLKPWHCVLLYGPPGTGKTHLSRSIAREVNSRFYSVSSSDLISTWSGQSEKLIRELFDHALGYEGVSIIFIDEVDSLCRARCSNEDEGSRRVKTELLLQLQRLHSSNNSTVLICATNCPWDLDIAFLRRFEKRIFVGLPDFEARRVLLKNLLSKLSVEDSIDWDLIARSTDGFSGDDLKRLSREIAFFQFRMYKEMRSMKPDVIERGSNFIVPISEQDFREVLRGFSPSVDQTTLSAFLKYAS